ncbi:MAG: hypothetical protein KJN71_04825 [Acidimicrobiia bacterium]|nr:hypothetical protein [Acidimicrobiia bacterium]NNC76060.1 hypothetical protein [Acidimicrobiia bacterium]
MNRIANAVQCRLTGARLAAGMSGGDHLAACLACQAEEAKYRSLSRQLAALRTVGADAPADLAPAVMTRVRKIPQERDARPGLNRALVAGVSSVTAAAVAGAVMVLARRRTRVA